MKKGFLLLFLSVSFCAVQAQHELMLHLAPRLGSKAFSLEQAVSHPGGTYQMQFVRFEYYISEIKITHDGGQVTPCTGVYLLVRPAKDSMYSLGQMPNIAKVEAITFSVGVPEAMNHADPAVQPAGHALAPQNPSMHWGWASGYRFAAIEGKAGANLSQSFEIHALGDANYKTQTIRTGAEQVNPDRKMIHLVADYAQSVKSVNLSTGPIVHGASGSAVTVLNNFQNTVFRAETSTAVVDPVFEGTFALTSNPARATVPTIQFSLPAGHDYALSVTDLTGRALIRQTLAAGDNQSLPLEAIPTTGVCFVHLWQNGRLVVTEKLVVLE